MGGYWLVEPAIIYEAVGPGLRSQELNEAVSHGLMRSQ